MRLCYRSQRRFCSKKGEDISIIKNRKRESSGICKRSVEKEIYQIIEITIDITSILCAKERWEEEDGAELSIFETVGQSRLIIHYY